MQTSTSAHKEVLKLKNPKQAKNLQRFFKTGKGEYGEGDIFYGLTVPQARGIVKKYKDLKISEVRKLIKSKIHEERLIALLILVHQYKGNEEQIYNLYLKSTKYINNWDLVDLSAPKIVGAYLLDKPTTTLNKLAKSKNLWERRIAVLATAPFIRENRFKEILNLSEKLMDDKHDLIHKAVGWMLREVGKQSQPTLEKFLKKHKNHMPRTMLRYSIEKFPERKRKAYLLKK